MAESQFAGAIREAMQAKGVTQARLAHAIGHGPGYVSKLVNDKIRRPGAKVVAALEEYLEIDLAGKLGSPRANRLFLSVPTPGAQNSERARALELFSDLIHEFCQEVDGVYWLGDHMSGSSDGLNEQGKVLRPAKHFQMSYDALDDCQCLAYIQLAPVEGSSSAPIELGYALARKLPVLVIVKRGVEPPIFIEALQSVSRASRTMYPAEVVMVDTDGDAIAVLRDWAIDALGPARH